MLGVLFLRISMATQQASTFRGSTFSCSRIMSSFNVGKSDRKETQHVLRVAQLPKQRWSIASAIESLSTLCKHCYGVLFGSLLGFSSCPACFFCALLSFPIFAQEMPAAQIAPDVICFSAAISSCESERHVDRRKYWSESLEQQCAY